MEVVVHTVGGVLGLDRTVRVTPDELTVRDAEGPARPVTLTPDATRSILDAAARVGPGPDRASVDGVTDEARTDIVITDDASTRRATVVSGQRAPDEVYRLLDLVAAAAER